MMQLLQNVTISQLRYLQYHSGRLHVFLLLEIRVTLAYYEVVFWSVILLILRYFVDISFQWWNYTSTVTTKIRVWLGLRLALLYVEYLVILVMTISVSGLFRFDGMSETELLGKTAQNFYVQTVSQHWIKQSNSTYHSSYLLLNDCSLMIINKNYKKPAIIRCTGTFGGDCGWLLACRPSAESVRHCNVDTSCRGRQSPLCCILATERRTDSQHSTAVSSWQQHL